MNTAVIKKIVIALGAVALGVAVFVLREATQSEHFDTHPDSQVTIVVDASTNRSERTQTVEEMTVAQLTFCRLEVNSDPVGEITPLADDASRFRLVLQRHWTTPTASSSRGVSRTGCSTTTDCVSCR